MKWWGNLKGISDEWYIVKLWHLWDAAKDSLQRNARLKICALEKKTDFTISDVFPSK